MPPARFSPSKTETKKWTRHLKKQQPHDAPAAPQPPRRTVLLASAWLTREHARLCAQLATAHNVLDYRAAQTRFHWSEIDAEWDQWNAKHLVDRGLCNPRARQATVELESLAAACDSSILVLPCGAGAHMLAGMLVERGIPTCLYVPKGVTARPELLYTRLQGVFTTVPQLNKWLAGLPRTSPKGTP